MTARAEPQINSAGPPPPSSSIELREPLVPHSTGDPQSVTPTVAHITASSTHPQVIPTPTPHRVTTIHLPLLPLRLRSAVHTTGTPVHPQITQFTPAPTPHRTAIRQLSAFPEGSHTTPPLDIPPPYTRIAPTVLQPPIGHRRPLQTPASSSPAYVINNHYLLPGTAVLSDVPLPTTVASQPSPEHGGANAIVMDHLLHLFAELQIDQRSQELIVGGLGAARGSVNWRSLLTNSSSVNREHHAALLEILDTV